MPHRKAFRGIEFAKSKCHTSRATRIVYLMEWENLAQDDYLFVAMSDVINWPLLQVCVLPCEKRFMNNFTPLLESIMMGVNDLTGNVDRFSET